MRTENIRYIGLHHIVFFRAAFETELELWIWIWICPGFTDRLGLGFQAGTGSGIA